MNLSSKGNVFDNIPITIPNEIFEKIIENNSFTLERIISEKHKSPPGFWYNQDKSEFVLLLQGSAQLLYDNEQSFDLKPGDYLVIPTHQKHRVEKTDENVKTIWLAIHF